VALPADITAILGDITVRRVDAIVNAANGTLLGGGGVDGAIHRAAGPGLLAECRALGGCATGQARITKGYGLPSKYVIHTVGPVWRGGGNGEDELLANCYRSCFELATRNGIKSLAFPAVSTGTYGFPASRAAAIAVREARAFMSQKATVESIIFVCFDRAMYGAYQKELAGQYIDS
jgi:O-acetyl-ADP-ribose deacetylase (regulator of RNase III)